MRQHSVLLTVFSLLTLTPLCWGQSAQMKVSMRNGSSSYISLDQIQKITFARPTDISGGRAPCNIPQALLLLQNYPNPFNPSTTITYKLPTRGEVQVEVFNLNGQLVSAVDLGMREAGAHNVEWDGKNQSGIPVPSGVYFCQIRHEKAVAIKKMMLLK